MGHGQFSVVYRAQCIHDQTIVALKKVQIYEMMDAKARQDCIKEIELLKVHITPVAKRISSPGSLSAQTFRTL